MEVITLSRRTEVTILAPALLLAFSVSNTAAQNAAASNAAQQAMLRMAKDIHKAIVTLPQYGVFDNISYGIKGRIVILRGQASRPTLKSGIENIVKKVEGVEVVENEIEVLPLSPNDDKIRAAAYVALYRYAPLQKYTSNRAPRPTPSVSRAAGGITNDPPIGWHAIHIIVNNRNVTLTGVVDSEGDQALAEMRANSVSGVFSVQNELQVAAKSK
jgi:hyperosmotically inducible periplasmic protein